MSKTVPLLKNGKTIQTLENLYGVTTFYELGPSSGQPVILVPGFLCSSMMYSQFADFLSKEGYLAISYDVFGTGGSQKKCSKPYSMSLFVSQLEALVEYLNLENIILVGYSMGGAISSSFASQHPDLVKKILLLSPAAMDVQRGPDNIVRIITTRFIGELFFRFFYPFMILGAVQVNFVDPGAKHLAAIIQFLYLHIFASWALNPTFPHAACEIMRKIDYSHVLPTYSNLPAPTLVVLGKNDLTVPYEANFKFWSEAICSPEVVSIDGAGHWLIHEKEKEFQEVALRFFSEASK